MRILNLEIENIRGIRKKLSLSPNGENFVIFGPNGTGKSAIVDAIDFLFSGKISRLIGRGTGGISFKKHAAHIDCEPEDAVVRASIKIPSVDDPINIERKMSNAKELIYPEDKKDALNEVLQVAQRGHHVLSRREILKYVAAEPGKRSEEVQSVLNLSSVEDIRKILVSIKTDAERGEKAAQSQLNSSISSINTTLSLDTFSEDGVLKGINNVRSILRGKALDELAHDNLKKGITPPSMKERKTTINIELLNKDLKAVERIIKENGGDIYESERKLRDILRELKEDAKLRRDLASKRLIDLGISLIDESGACPLCLKPWGPGELKAFLNERQLKAKEATKVENEITKISTTIDGEIVALKEYLERIKNSCDFLKQDDIASRIQSWVVRVEEWSERLGDPIEKCDVEGKIPSEIKVLCGHDTYEKDFEKIKKSADKITPRPSPEQNAWDTLTRLETLLERYFEVKKEKEIAQLFSKRAAAVYEAYEKSKDKILGSLYSSVQNDFVDYYKELHGEDENGFTAKFQPSGAGLDFEVDFYQRGQHPPLALHSEGHQDSMGLCLYLALSKRLSEGKVSFTILDDVVMSIDNQHRRDICRLLKKYFLDHQFLLTTHNRTWARQLNTDGVVTKKNMTEFKGWSVDTGPAYQEDVGFWAKIQTDLDNNDISAAAATLRINSEYFFEMACDSLQGKITYKGDGRWELGDYLPGTVQAYKKHLRQAKATAQSWGNDEVFQKIQELETIANEIINRSQCEQWAINENVHYSKWADFSKPDFQPIVEAFKDLHDLFKCSKCQGLLFITMKGKDPQNLRCPCGKVDYNLLKKGLGVRLDY